MATSLYDFGGFRGRRGSRAINFTSLLADEEGNLKQTKDGETVGLPPEPDPAPISLDGGAGSTGSGFLGDGDGTADGSAPGGGTADPSQGGSVGIGGGVSQDASGQPGTGGVGGLVDALMHFMPSFISVPAKGIEMATGKKMGSVFGYANPNVGEDPGTEPGSPSPTAMTGIDPSTGISPGMQQAVNDAVAGPGGNAGQGVSPAAPGSAEAAAQAAGVATNDTGQNTTGASPGDGGGGDASGVGDGSGVAGPGDGGSWAQGGLVTKDRLMGPDPAGPDDGYGALKHGEAVLQDTSVAKLLPGDLHKLVTGQFDPQALHALLSARPKSRLTAVRGTPR